MATTAFSAAQESLLANYNETRGEDALTFPLDSADYLTKRHSPSLGPFSSFPTTCSLVILIHVIFLYQVVWKKKKVVVTYQSIVRRKRFHRLWLALLSHPPVQETRSPSESSARGDVPSFRGQTRGGDGLFYPAVDMAGPTENERRSFLQGSSFTRSVVERGKGQWKSLTKGRLSGYPLLLYNSHILWSCRALEQVYDHNEPYKYARSLVTLSTLGVMVELLLTQALVQTTIRRQQQQQSGDSFREIQPTFDRSLDLSVLDQIRQRVENRAIGTTSMLASSILVLFHFQYTDIPLALLPFFPDRFFSRYPGTTYLFCLAILTVLARSSHPMGVVTGTLVGLFWVAFSLDFLADSYYGNWLVLIALILTFLSLKGQSPHIIPCIEYVSWYDPDVIATARNESATLQHSWCLQPVDLDDCEDDDDGNASSDTEYDDTDSPQGRDEALLEFTRVHSSESDTQEATVDPDILVQGRRPRRTRIQSQRL